MVRVRRQAKKGFTLIELMVVILIIAMLGTFVAPNVMSKFRRAKADLAKPQHGGDRGRPQAVRA